MHVTLKNKGQRNSLHQGLVMRSTFQLDVVILLQDVKLHCLVSVRHL